MENGISILEEMMQVDWTGGGRGGGVQCALRHDRGVVILTSLLAGRRVW
jgi:hypothetical protein